MYRNKGLKALLFALLFVLLFSLPAAAEVEINAEAAILIDATTGYVLFELDSDKRWYPASMTKLMTLVVVLDLVEQGQFSLDEKVITSENAASYGGAQLYLEVGEEFTLDDMLKAIILGSANDASVAVAEHIAGSEADFAVLMNEKSREIGAINTNFVNAHGLHHEDHYSTARDMALIAQYSLRFPRTLEYTSMQYHEFREDPPTARYSLNRLLWWYPGADGFKTGTTSAARRNLVATASRDGLRLISVVMGIDEVNGHFRESMKLLNYGFSRYTFKQFYAENTVFGQVRVGMGAKDFVDLIVVDNVGITILKGQDDGYSTRIVMQPYLSAPIAKDMVAGELIVMKDGNEIKKFDLVTAEGIERASIVRMIVKVIRNVFIITA